MARGRARRRSDSKDTRESEKHRAKRNRDKFRQLITELNDCVSEESLSTNKCLSTAISILSLEKVHKSSDSTIEEIGDFSSSSSGSSDCSSPGQELQHLLSARDCFGIGFNESGTILYASPNIKTAIGYKESVLGENLDKVVLRSEDILNKIFTERNCHFICMVHLVKMAGKDLAPFHFQGKILPCQDGGRMYLGYAEKKHTIIHDPMCGFNVNEILINLDLSFVSKRNIYIDSLLGYPTFNNCTTEHVLSEDLSNVFTEPDDALERSLIRTFQEDGFAQHVVRLVCADNTILYVLAKVFLHINQEKVPVMISYSIPFAFSSQSQKTIDEGMRMITSNEQWLALMPSFFTPPETPVSLGDISPILPDMMESPTTSDGYCHDSPPNMLTFPSQNSAQTYSDSCKMGEFKSEKNNLVNVLELL